jgi:hypothetical protein
MNTKFINIKIKERRLEKKIVLSINELENSY